MSVCVRDDSTGAQACERNPLANSWCVGMSMKGRHVHVAFDCGTAYQPANSSAWYVRSTVTIYPNSSDCAGASQGTSVTDGIAPTSFGLWEMTALSSDFVPLDGNVSVSWARACSVRLDEPAPPLPPLGPVLEGYGFVYPDNPYSVCVTGPQGSRCDMGALTELNNELCVDASSGGHKASVLLYCPPLTYLGDASGWQVGASNIYYSTSSTCGRALSESGTAPQSTGRVSWRPIPTQPGESVKVTATMGHIDGIQWSLDCNVAVQGSARPGSGGHSKSNAGLALGVSLGLVALVALAAAVVSWRRRQAAKRAEGRTELLGGRYQATV